MKKAVVFNLGCKVNQYECDVLSAALEQKGYATSEKLEAADLYLINTCAVTAEAERKSRQIVARVKKLNPAAQIVITGCASQKNRDFYVAKGITCVSGVSGKAEIIAHINEKYIAETALSSTYEDDTVAPKGQRTRAYVKIQDGCNNFCSYCIIPYLRGRSRSRSVENSAKEIALLAERGTPEIVITGINLSQYGADTGESLAALIRAIKDIDVRIRLGSFYVEGIERELLDALKSLRKFCPHFHLSLQSGDDTVLKAMNRHYSAEEYAKKVALIREYFPLASVTTDIIVGFPAETDECFLNTMKFIESVGFSDLHIFPFSPREGTVAAKMQLIPSETVRERRIKLENLRDSQKMFYLEKMKNVPQEVVFECINGGIAEGYSQYYVRVYAKTLDKYGIIIPTEKFKEGLIGEVKNG